MSETIISSLVPFYTMKIPILNGIENTNIVMYSDMVTAKIKG